MSAERESDKGKIITFYSYKGGTGRSMALANIAWILASKGHRVLMIDWDLEAPGLHRYFHPFLLDPELTSTDGLIDFVTEYVVEAMTPPVETNSADGKPDMPPWYDPFAEITRYAVSLTWPHFAAGGTLDLVPAGRQGRAYAARANSFNWRDFYERLGGGAFLDLAKAKMRAVYDYILIDSRTGVSDTAGICTVQLPDILAVCFTFNIQSMEGAAAVAESVREHPQRSTARVFPIPMRVELAEKDKLEMARNHARQRFDPLLSHMDVLQRETYWGDVEVLYQPFYAYEEMLATFGDRPNQTNSVLAAMERITAYLTRGSVRELVPPTPDERGIVLARYARQPQPPQLPSPAAARHRTGYFISYSPSDGQDFAIRLCDALEAGPPSYSVWLDKRQIRPSGDWDEQIVEAIRTAESLLFVMTRDSVDSQSVCKQEWTRALRYQKPIIPLLVHRDAEIPFRLGSRHYIDFTGAFEPALAQLHMHLGWLGSPEGRLQLLRDRLADALRDAARVADRAEKTRLDTEIAQLEAEIQEQLRVVDNPAEAARRVEESIALGLERERQPEKPLGGVGRTKFINPPPGIAPSYFQDRFVETKLVGDFLKDESRRVMTVVGRAGIGKTTMVCRVLKSLEGGQLPDGGGPLHVDGIVYLSASGSRRVTVPNLYADLTRLLPDATANALDALYKDPRATTEAKMRSLLEAFPHGCVVVLLDNFEDVIDPATQNIRDAELDEALRALLNLPHSAVKAILTTRIAPYALALVQPGRQFRLELDQGLESPYAENILREMDIDGTLGLQTAPADLLDEARQRTLGYPRALEALFAILSVDRYTTLREVLNDAEKLLPENVVEVLVGEAFSRLDPAAQKVMQALGVYARPVTPAAVDYLLQPHLPGVNSAPIANRLVNMHFARREAGRYYLHPVDRAYAFTRIPQGEELDRSVKDSPPYTQFALLHRGAEYFNQVRKPREDWKTIEDLAPQLAEFDLRYAGQSYDTAATVLLDIGFDLFLWGHYRLLVELHERLQGRLRDPQLKIGSVGHLGMAYYRMGQIRKAIACFEQALDNAREIQDRSDEGVWLGNLGLCYANLGQTTHAIDYHEQALVISLETGNRHGEGIHLGDLGDCYAELGQTARAIDYYEQALVIAREIVDRSGEAMDLSNLGNRYADLGQAARAMECYEQSLLIAREIGDRFMESGNLAYKGDALVGQGEWEKAIQLYSQAIQIADEIGNPQFQQDARKGLAFAHLYADDLSAARVAAETARQYDAPQNNHHVLALLGVILLRQGDHPAAQEAFAAAVTQADALLTHTAQYYGALDTKGLALCGLVLCGTGEQLTTAVEAFQAARAINQDPGIVQRILRLLDALALADAAGVLAQIRAAAAGQ